MERSCKYQDILPYVDDREQVGLGVALIIHLIDLIIEITQLTLYVGILHSRGHGVYCGEC